MRFSVLRLRPVDDPLPGVPLVNMQHGNLLDPLPRKHQYANGAGVWRVHRRIGTLQPTIESDKLVLIEPTRTDDLRLGGDATCRVVDELKSSRRRAAIVML